jgi:hypothetical protein
MSFVNKFNSFANDSDSYNQVITDINEFFWYTGICYTLLVNDNSFQKIYYSRIQLFNKFWISTSQAFSPWPKSGEEKFLRPSKTKITIKNKSIVSLFKFKFKIKFFHKIIRFYYLRFNRIPWKVILSLKLRNINSLYLRNTLYIIFYKTLEIRFSNF